MRRGVTQTTTIGRSEARAQLARLLTCARPEKLAGFTVEELAAINATPRAEIAVMLAEAQQGRLVL